jgi:hypothetical protein
VKPSHPKESAWISVQIEALTPIVAFQREHQIQVCDICTRSTRNQAVVQLSEESIGIVSCKEILRGHPLPVRSLCSIPIGYRTSSRAIPIDPVGAQRGYNGAFEVRDLFDG